MKAELEKLNPFQRTDEIADAVKAIGICTEVISALMRRMHGCEGSLVQAGLSAMSPVDKAKIISSLLESESEVRKHLSKEAIQMLAEADGPKGLDDLMQAIEQLDEEGLAQLMGRGPVAERFSALSKNVDAMTDSLGKAVVDLKRTLGDAMQKCTQMSHALRSEKEEDMNTETREAQQVLTEMRTQAGKTNGRRRTRMEEDHEEAPAVKRTKPTKGSANDMKRFTEELERRMNTA